MTMRDFITELLYRVDEAMRGVLDSQAWLAASWPSCAITRDWWRRGIATRYVILVRVGNQVGHL